MQKPPSVIVGDAPNAGAGYARMCGTTTHGCRMQRMFQTAWDCVTTASALNLLSTAGWDSGMSVTDGEPAVTLREFIC